MSILLKTVLLSAFVVVSITSCQGDGTDGSLNYTGVTSQSVINEGNAQELGEAALLGVSVGTSVTVAGAQSGPRGSVGALPATITRALHRAANSIDVAGSPSAITNQRMMGGPMPPMHGHCGGQATGDMTIDDVALTFTGEIDFDHFCAGPTTDPMHGFTMHGHVTFAGHGHFEGDDYVIDRYTMVCSRLVTSTADGSTTMSGTLQSTVTSETVYDSMINMRIREDHEGMVYQLENYLVSVDETSDPAHLSVSGRAYHPGHGYVVVSTPTTIEFPHGVPGTPNNGVALLTGASGAVGPGTARMTFIDISSYTIAVDEDGDGATDMTWSCTWEPGICVAV